MSPCCGGIRVVTIRMVVVLPGAVRAEQAEDLPLPDGEADVVDGQVIAETVAEVVDDEGVPAHC